MTSRHKAEKMLKVNSSRNLNSHSKGYAEKTFIVRRSTHSPGYVLSYVSKNSKVCHIGNILEKDGKIYALNSNGEEDAYNTLLEYVIEMRSQEVIDFPLEYYSLPPHERENCLTQ